MPSERLQKIIAAAGVASRRKAEELITSGRVFVNGQPVTQLGTKANAEQDHIRVDGKLLQGPERFTYVALNKPKGYVTTVSDEKKRPTVMDLVQKVKGRVYPVGRLDWASEGLLLMTNDGALANALMKASSNVAKVYVVKVAGQPDEGKLDKLRRGVSIAEKGGRRVRTAPATIRLIREGDNPWLEVTIIEGRNRQVRKMFEEVGHHVEKIRRVQYGPLALDVPPGDWRNLTLLEVAKLKTAASGVKVASPPTPTIPLRPRIRPPKVVTRKTASTPMSKTKFANTSSAQSSRSARSSPFPKSAFVTPIPARTPMKPAGIQKPLPTGARPFSRTPRAANSKGGPSFSRPSSSQNKSSGSSNRSRPHSSGAPHRERSFGEKPSFIPHSSRSRPFRATRPSQGAKRKRD